MKKNIFEKRPKLTIFIFLIFIVVCLDFLFTYLYSIYWTGVIKKYNERGQIMVAEHPTYHHTFPKNKSLEMFHHFMGWEWTQHTNSLGFKDEFVRDVPLETNQYRILAIGDSFGEGVGLHYEDTFVGILHKHLSKKNIDVLNASRASYSPIIYWRKTKHLLEVDGLKFNELLVFIDISDAHDEARIYKLDENLNVVDRDKDDPAYLKSIQVLLHGTNNRLPETNALTKKILLSTREFITKKTTLLYLVTNATYDWYYSDKRVPYLHLDLNFTKDKWTFDDKAYNEFGKEGEELMVLYMNKLLDLCKDHKIKLRLAIYPNPSQIWYDSLDSRQVKLWENWTLKNNIDFINLFPLFIDEKKSGFETLEIIDKYYFKYDMHFNKLGNKVVGDYIYENHY